ncbi:MAG: FAD-binding oxidoreductase [Acidimicrobiales bacterium]
MDRREFLRSAGRAALALGTVALGGGALGELAGCSRGNPGPVPQGPSGRIGSATTRGTATTSNGPGTTETTIDHGPPDWAALAKSLKGRLVLPGQGAYPTATQLFNPTFDSVHPAAVAYCASVSDVQRSIEFARAHGVALATRSGGHSFAGYSTGPGLVLDVSSMGTVAVDQGANTARVGAGARLIDLYSSLDGQGVALAGGSCPTVGIAGLTLGGGLGVVDRTHGLTCDALASLDIVTADSRLLTCNQGSQSDLYWASQGGGGGSFGVATSFSFLVHPTDQLALFTLEWPWAAAPDVVGAWLAWARTAPDALWANCQMGAPGAVAPSLRVTGVWVGSAGDLSVALAPLRRAVGSATTYDFVGPEPFLKAMMIEAGCEGDSLAECHLPSENPSGVLARSPFATKSNFLTASLSGTGVSAVVAAVEDRQGLGVAGSGGIVLSTTGGAINRVPVGATAFVHRDTEYLMEYNAGWDTGAPASVVAANRAWLAHAWSSMQPYVSTQAYQNYMDPTLSDWQQAYYGSSLARMVKVKAAYDPDDVFRFAQAIPTR